MENINLTDAEMLAALQSGYQTVQVLFPKEGQHNYSSGSAADFGEKAYTYKVPTYWNVKVDDWIIVLPSNVFKAVKVINVDATPRLLNDRNMRAKWAVGRIDTQFYFGVQHAEDQMLQHIREMRAAQEREALLANLRQTIGGSVIEDAIAKFGNMLSPNALNNAIGFSAAPAGTGKTYTAETPVQPPSVRESFSFDATKHAPAQGEAEDAQVTNETPVPPSWARTE